MLVEHHNLPLRRDALAYHIEHTPVTIAEALPLCLTEVLFVGRNTLSFMR